MKNKLTGVLLAVFLGPLGLLYSSILGALIYGIIIPTILISLGWVISSQSNQPLASVIMLFLIVYLIFLPIMCGITAYFCCKKKNERYNNLHYLGKGNKYNQANQKMSFWKSNDYKGNPPTFFEWLGAIIFTLLVIIAIYIKITEHLNAI